MSHSEPTLPVIAPRPARQRSFRNPTYFHRHVIPRLEMTGFIPHLFCRIPCAGRWAQTEPVQGASQPKGHPGQAPAEAEARGQCLIDGAPPLSMQLSFLTAPAQCNTQAGCTYCCMRMYEAGPKGHSDQFALSHSKQCNTEVQECCTRKLRSVGHSTKM